MPWMALVPDINGVCKVLGTLEITEKPTNPASTKIARLASSVIGHPSTVPRCGDAGRGDDLVVEIRHHLAICDQHVFQQCSDVAGVQLAGVLGHGRRQVQRRGDRDVVPDDGLARARSARSCRRLHRRGRPPRCPASFPRTASAVTSRGAGRPGTSAVVITTSNPVIAFSSAAAARPAPLSVSSRA